VNDEELHLYLAHGLSLLEWNGPAETEPEDQAAVIARIHERAHALKVFRGPPHNHQRQRDRRIRPV
jgi:hypothetical protein